MDAKTLQDKIESLEIQLRHLENDFFLTQEENKISNQKYLGILSELKDKNKRLNDFQKNLERIIDERTRELKKSQMFLQEKSKEQEIILNSSPVMIYYKDLERRFVQVNKAFAGFLGLSLDNIIGKSTLELMPDKAEQSEKEDREIIETGEPKLSIHEYYNTPKGKRWILTDKIPYQDFDGNIKGIIGFTLDITEIKKAEEDLIKLNHILENITQGIDESILLINKDYTIVWANERFLRTLGYKLEMVIGKPCYKITHGVENPCDSKNDECPIRGISVKNVPITVTHTHFDSTGHKKFVEVTVYPIRDKSGEIIQYIHMSKDITNKKQLEEERIKASRLKGIYDLVVTVNHEMNQPLAVIAGYCELLLKEAEQDGKVSKIALSINKATWRLAELVKKVGRLKEKKIDMIKTTEYGNGETMIDLNSAEGDRK